VDCTHWFLLESYLESFKGVSSKYLTVNFLRLESYLESFKGGGRRKANRISNS